MEAERTTRQMLAARIRGVYGILDEAAGRDLEEVAEAYISCGANALQLRMKDVPTRRCIDVATVLRDRCRQAGVLFIINDRADIAASIEADGVHLGQSDVPVAAARLLLPHGLIGKSTHNERQIHLAVAEGADYIGFGPVFRTSSKTVIAPVVGVKVLQEAVKISSVPVVAIGGIALDNVKQVVATGVPAIATISAVAKAWQPTDAVRSLVRAFKIA
jgi:thiamine-phosphate pyrophosphorylase